MKTDLVIEDFKYATYLSLREHYEILEIAQIKKHTMNRGRIFLPKEEIKFEPLTLDCYPMQVFERLRWFSTPKLKETKIGKLLVWDNYALRIRK